jgi:hypothetical protein
VDRCGRRQVVLGQLRERLADIVDGKTNVMQPWAMLFQPGLQRMIGRQRLDKLQLRIPEIEMREPDRALVDNFAKEQPQSDAIAPDL